MCYCYYAHYCLFRNFRFIGWLESVGSRVVYELDYKKPILYVITIQSKLPVVLVGDTGTIPHHLRNTFPGAPGDRRHCQTGCWRWMQDVVRQLVGFGMVPGHVMNL